MAFTNAAENLEGLVLDTGWEVKKRIPKPSGATGGFFSVCYTVTKNGEECFLKAFNFAQFLNLATAHGKTRPIVDVIGEMIDAYKYERDLSALCRNQHVTKVAFVRDAGEQIVTGYAITVVPYLIFDIADGGDLRSHLTFASNLVGTNGFPRLQLSSDEATWRRTMSVGTSRRSRVITSPASSRSSCMNASGVFTRSFSSKP